MVRGYLILLWLGTMSTPHKPSTLLLAALLLVACRPAPDHVVAAAAPFDFPSPPVGCKLTPLATPDKISPCSTGAGNFGHWILDAAGLPAYEYDLDQGTASIATYNHSVDPTRTDHVHQLGNDRLNALAYNEGYVVLAGQERGVTLYNHFDPARDNYAGGFSIIADPEAPGGASVWNSAHRYRPAGAKTRRVFGLGYYETVTQHQGLRVTHRIVAPSGDASLLVDEVLVQNLTRGARTVRHYEYWDVNRHQLAFQPLRTGLLSKSGDAARRALNKPFDQQLTRDGDVVQASFLLRAGQTRPAAATRSATDHYPATLFLAALSGSGPVEVYTDQRQFLGSGGITSPSAAGSGRAGELMAQHSALDQPAALIMRHDLQLPPGGSRRLRFAFGYLPSGQRLSALLAPWRPVVSTSTGASAASVTSSLDATRARWKERLAYFAAPEAPQLSREVPWHAYQLLSSAGSLDYFKTRVTPQGSAYLYLHGFDGAPRDLCLFSLPLAYLDPALARANLTLVMGMTRASDGQISYAYHGHGTLESALIHQRPSDLDLFFMLALYEYLAATGHHEFLNFEVPFHPRGAAAPTVAKDRTVLGHLRLAVDHLINSVKRGDKGLVRLSDGDWSDSIVWDDPATYDSAKTIEHGESIPNTQMAVHVLPRLARVVAAQDALLAQKMTAYAEKLRAPLRAQFTGKWFLRAWMRDKQDNHLPVGTASIDLEAQPWGLIADGLLTTQQRATLAAQVRSRLSTPLGPALKAGGMVWPAVGQLMTWAYGRVSQPWAFAALQSQSLATRAEAFPEHWFGIWSAPDGLYSSSGSTWKSVATPMTDWPVLNNNTHAMFLLGLLRVAGVEPATSGGLRVQPATTPGRYTLDLPLLRIAVQAGQLNGVYRAATSGATTVTLVAPAGATLTEVKLRGVVQTLASGATEATLKLGYIQGDSIAFSARWQ
jgi:Glycosyl hydrolase 36 superfamily, catalytic domain/Glycosyltransferase family 36